jgi:tetratricopeptide (TPR) repeat protein
MRRLLADPMYRRDFAAQKSFSKLRAAIAGLYIRQGRYREGSQAFREACLLYPASPEATFRYVQECLLPFRKWDETLEILSYTDEIDPDNRRTASMRDYVNRIQTLLSETERLEKLRQGKGLNEIESLMLARCYFDLGRGGEAATLTAPLVSKLKDANSLKVAYTILLESRFVREGEEALNAYLKLNPTGDAEAWLQLALIQHRAGRRAAAMSSFNQAVYVNSSVVERRLQKRESDLIEIYTGWARHQPRNRQRESTSVWK